MIKKSYSELIRISQFDERLNYLKLYGKVGYDIFGFDRAFNQKFYSSKEWREVRDYIFYRDRGCDLGIEGYDIVEKRARVIHHINPITMDDLSKGTELLLDPDNLITTTAWTHRIIHYGTGNDISLTLERSLNDTCPWKNIAR